MNEHEDLLTLKVNTLKRKYSHMSAKDDDDDENDIYESENIPRSKKLHKMEIKKNDRVTYYTLQVDKKNVGSVSLKDDWQLEVKEGSFRILQKQPNMPNIVQTKPQTSPKPSTSGARASGEGLRKQQEAKHENAPTLIRVKIEPRIKQEIKQEEETDDDRSLIEISSDSEDPDSSDTDTGNNPNVTTCLIHGKLYKKQKRY